MSYISVIFFYSLIILLIYFNRKKFEFQGKIIAMYRTKIGIKWMDRLAKLSPRFWKVFGFFAIITGYLGLIFISAILLKGTWDLLFVAGAPASITPVLPGVRIPGGIYIPLWSGILSIFIVASVHEFAHGIMARVYDLKVKSSGIFFLGPIIGAFVEPDEKKLFKSKKYTQLSVLAAGPFSNICLAIIVALFLFFLLIPGTVAMFNATGVEIGSVTSNFPAEESGLQGGEVIITIDGVKVTDIVNFTKKLNVKSPGDSVILGTESQDYTIKLIENPKNASSAYMGVTLNQKWDVKKNIAQKVGNTIPWFMFTIIKFLNILITLSLGIGFANLLPLGPVDGGRMLQVSLRKFFNNTKADFYWTKISLITFVILLFNLFFPIFRNIGRAFVF